MKNRMIACGLMAVFLSAHAAHAQAVSGAVPFSGTVNSSCTVIVGSNGTLAASTDGTVLGSKNGGGSAGTAQVFTNDGSFGVSVANPTGFDTKPGAFSGVPDFLAEFALSTGKSGNGNSPAPVKVPKGQTDVNVDLTATLTNAVFDKGDYKATVVLTCE